jgi:hypothetical protein
VPQRLHAEIDFPSGDVDECSVPDFLSPLAGFMLKIYQRQHQLTNECRSHIKKGDLINPMICIIMKMDLVQA